tara:strand:- start:5 stop:214 length:210 start_codon:yes stop_codon:yes gene_type:complete
MGFWWYKLINKIMRRFLGLEQKATDRTIKEWRESLTDEQRKRMNIPKESFDLSTGNIKKHFGNYFKPNK